VSPKGFFHKNFDPKRLFTCKFQIKVYNTKLPLVQLWAFYFVFVSLFGYGIQGKKQLGHREYLKYMLFGIHQILNIGDIIILW